jgi:DNA-binding NarL/FixJ family response regulator
MAPPPPLRTSFLSSRRVNAGGYPERISMIRVFVVAPTPMMLAGLRTMLSTQDIEVVGAASTLVEIISELPDVDVIVMDEMSLEDVGRAMANGGTVALVVLTNNHERALSALRSISLPGWSIVSLDATTTQLQASVVAAAQGLITLPAPFADRLFEQRPLAGIFNPSSLDEPLTTREREVLELVSQGLSNKLIARRLQISEHTVKFHISSITSKLGASSRTDAVSRGVRRGLITL